MAGSVQLRGTAVEFEGFSAFHMKTYPYAFVSVVMIAHLYMYMYVCSKAIEESPFTNFVAKDLRKKSNAVPHYDAELDTPLLPPFRRL